MTLFITELISIKFDATQSNKQMAKVENLYTIVYVAVIVMWRLRKRFENKFGSKLGMCSKSNGL